MPAFDKVKYLEIEKLVYGGSGLGFFQGKAVFLPYTAPGDRVAWHTEKEKARFILGRCREVLEPSPLRNPPRCPHFGQCGGCQWQHLSYEAQVAWKESIFREIMVRHAGFEDFSPGPPIHSPPWQYRARTRLSIKWHETGPEVGYLRARSHSIAKIDSCFLMRPRVAKIHATCLENILNSRAARKAAFYSATIETGDTGGCRLILECQPQLNSSTQKGVAKAAADSLAGLDFATSVWIRPRNSRAFRIFPDPDGKFDQRAAPAILPLNSGTLKLAVPPLGFYQVNLVQNQRLVKLLMEAIRETTPAPANILDLYCGMGNFSLPAATLAERVIGVDHAGESIEAAVENARFNAITNASFKAADVEDFVQNRKQLQGHGLVILDPPRTGAIKVARALADAAPPTIVYISCDPMTLCRDLRVLKDAGYGIRWCVPVDMFPQTFHIESITVLDRGAASGSACMTPCARVM